MPHSDRSIRSTNPVSDSRRTLASLAVMLILALDADAPGASANTLRLLGSHHILGGAPFSEKGRGPRAHHQARSIAPGYRISRQKWLVVVIVAFVRASSGVEASNSAPSNLIVERVTTAEVP